MTPRRSSPPPSRSRQIKISCPGCGWSCRSTRVWIAVGVPACPNRACLLFGQTMAEPSFPAYLTPERTRRAAYGIAAVHGVSARHVAALNRDVWGAAGASDGPA